MRLRGWLSYHAIKPASILDTRAALLHLILELLTPQLLLSAQAGSDDLDRKRAVYLLQQLLTHQAQPQLNAWTTFLALHGALDEFAFNMVLPVWTHQVGGVFVEIRRWDL